MKVGSLFSGVGLMDYGLERSGMTTVWQVEQDEWCRDQLQNNFPNSEKFNDVRTVGKHNLENVDIICGGFPCQDLSKANPHGSGMGGERSGLWSEYFRIVCELRPRYALIENVAKLINTGLERIICDLASVGYDAEWTTLRSYEFGLFNPRERLFVVAVAQSDRVYLHKIFDQKHYKSLHDEATEFYSRHPARIRVDALRRSYPEIPRGLLVDDGRTFELSEIERAIKAYGNGVAVPCAEWIGHRIKDFDAENNFYYQETGEREDEKS